MYTLLITHCTFRRPCSILLQRVTATGCCPSIVHDVNRHLVSIWATCGANRWPSAFILDAFGSLSYIRFGHPEIVLVIPRDPWLVDWRPRCNKKKCRQKNMVVCLLTVGLKVVIWLDVCVSSGNFMGCF